MFKPDLGKCSIDGQKRWWNDVLVGDLRSIRCTPTGEKNHKTIESSMAGSMQELKILKKRCAGRMFDIL